MQTRLMFWLIAGGALACAAADSVRPDPTSATLIDPADPAVASVRQVGEQLIDRAGHLMIYEAERAVADHGVARAIGSMHLKTLDLPRAEPGLPRVTALKLTSLSLRNPANRPDAADQAALETIDGALRTGSEVPAILVQRVDHPGLPPEWRVYRPITTMPLCVKCHGATEDLKPDVRARLAQQYPEDHATGYTAYKWRGLIRVSLTGPEPAIALHSK